MEDNKQNRIIINKTDKRLTIKYGDELIIFDKDKLNPYLNTYPKDIFIRDLTEQIMLLCKYKLSNDELNTIITQIKSFLNIKHLTITGISNKL